MICCLSTGFSSVAEAAGAQPAITETVIVTRAPSAVVPPLTAPAIATREPMELPENLKPRPRPSHAHARKGSLALIAVGWSLFGLAYIAAGLQAMVFAAYGVEAGWFHLIPGIGPAIGGTVKARSMGAGLAVAGWSAAVAQSGGLALAIVGMVKLKRLHGGKARQNWGVVPDLDGAMAYYRLRF